MQLKAKKQTLRGDTLIEVLFAVAIFALVAISVTTLMNSMLGKSQSAIEIVMARSEIDDQAEAIRFIHSSRKNGQMKKAWSKINDRAINSKSIDYDVDKFLLRNVSSCTEFTSNSTLSHHAFYIDSFELSNYTDDTSKSEDYIVRQNINVASIFPRVLHRSTAYASGESVSTNFDQTATNPQAEGVWVVAVRDGADAEHANFYDFYIQTCWDAVNSSAPTTINTIIRLRNPTKAASTTPVTPPAPGGTTSKAVFYVDGSQVKEVEKTGANVALTSGDLPSDPAKSGNTFKGWKVEGADDSTATKTASSIRTGSSVGATRKYLAVWEPIPVCTSKIEFYNGSTRISESSGTCGQAVTPPNAMRTGYTFTGWRLNDAGSLVSTTTRGATSGSTNSYYAQFSVISHSVSVTYSSIFDGHIGNFTDTGTISCDSPNFDTSRTINGGSVTFVVDDTDNYTASRNSLIPVWNARLTINCSGDSVTFSAARR